MRHPWTRAAAFFGTLIATFTLAAQEAAGTAGAGGTDQPSGGLFDMIVAMAPAFVLCYLVLHFMVFRPQKRQQAQHARMLDELKKNDTVRTKGGFFGKVVSVDQEHGTVTLKIDEQNNTRIRVTRSSIEAIVSDDYKASDANKAKQKAEVGS